MRRRAVVWACLPGLLFLLWGCGPDEGRGERTQEQDGKIKEVRVLTAKRSARQKVRSFAGTARAAETAPLGFEVGGKIRSIRVEMGQKVRAGEVVARLDARDYRLQAQRRQSGVDAAQAALNRARSDYRRVRDLYEMDHASRSELDRVQAKYLSAKANLREAKKALQLARDRVADCTLTTDRAGRISRVPAEEQQNVRAGQTVAVLSLTEAMQLRVFLPEEVITRIEPGDRARARFAALSPDTFPARVSEVAVEAARSTTYPVRLDLQRVPQGLRPGMVGRAEFRFPAPSRIILPARAVLGREGDTAWVFVVDPRTDLARRRSVEVGALTEQGLVIRSGLREGEEVVIRGMSRLEQGQRVKKGDG